ncbi:MULTISPECIES: xanthine dehydrogenase family protein molybdopterin-binding subunit [Pseudonocardia]|uniref:Carbon monoxide dehydrogenase large chain n=2 Tax=Pseudonocardia TaxID=1847 RepID=A0A1Y2N018_PSEAH|nr:MULTISPECIES: xanthine dehydrogenase family protein molybdopterin-binding subunit [Pseudonocardia]OSY40785.1 Carbon monoxide dehydrogenase large chain [Pseudonocardia autotrophica]TDN71908.1 carbon-monoxide dehydrogenase large subunit [Pseudonocardia autotrophica]BBG02596.1 carbon-monoxide dehydrogenase large subunit [Pseudonocardia autotrophica]GEC24655.1 carbon-monoxide dehydrogenase large subunit [Pseudonocardia saturnea]
MTSTSVAPSSGIGARQVRLEDPGLLTGRDRFTSDLDIPGSLHAVFVRSPVVHARVTGVDSTDAEKAPGVVAVLTHRDLDLPAVFFPSFGRLIDAAYHRVPLASDVVRFVGDIVAVVVAETLTQARDAADLVEIDYDPLEAVVDPDAATAADAPLLFPATGTNVAVDIPFEAGERIEAPVQVSQRVAHPRMAVAPMEPLAVAAVPGDGGRLTVWCSTQMPHVLQGLMAGWLQMDPADLRVVCPAVGGGFGGKTPAEPDYVLIAAVARHLGRPVRWTQTRSENLLTMQARGHLFDVTLEATGDGRITSIRSASLTDVGAYPGLGIGMAMTARGLMTGVYDIPHAQHVVRCVATNTSPTVPFRGAGRPEAIHALERTVDRLAVELGLDPVEIRRRNFVPNEKFPYVNIMGTEYDSADFGKPLDEALRIVGYDGLRAEQSDRRAAGDDILLGIGVSCYVEVSAGTPGMGSEYASVEVDEDGTATVVAGTSAHGQGHWTVYAQVVSEQMGIPVEQVRFVQSDTATVPRGMGTSGSRSLQLGGTAVRKAADEVVEQATQLAAHLLEASPDDIEVAHGQGLVVRGVPGRGLSWSEIAAAAADDDRRPPSMAPRLFADPGFDQGSGTSPFGAHIAVVEVDRQTGMTTLRRFVAVDDCGVVVNPLLAEGQVHGGVAAGIGQALFEASLFDEEGNPTTTSFAEYGMPSAADLISYDTAHTVTPTSRNPLGAKGLGEAGTTGSIAAVHNAVLDAVAHLGIHHIDLPLTPMRVWQALQDEE